MERSELEFYLALHFTNGIGSRRLLTLIDYFGGAEKAYQASSHELMKVPGFGKGTVEGFLNARAMAIEDARQQIDALDEHTRIVTYYDELYPGSLKNIDTAPPLLYVRGNADLLAEDKMIAIVGSRKTTEYGRRASKDLSEAMAREHVTVVSGFAKGIDTVAHQAVFDAGGKTIAVLGSGVDVIYPSTNKDLAKQLIASGRGAIVSELPLGTSPDARNFPWRNRIVSGLSKAVIIVESEVTGGSMITASLALDQNRDVFAIPGDITRPASSGPNHLIRESRAKLAVNAEQILSEIGWIARAGATARPKPVERTNLSLFEVKIVDVLEDAGGPVHIDALAERAGLEVQDILVQLLTLEFKNVVRQMAGKQFMLVNN